MTDIEYARTLEELDRLLNDPEVPMQPDRIWSLLADVSHPDIPCRAPAGSWISSSGPNLGAHAAKAASATPAAPCSHIVAAPTASNTVTTI